MHSYINYHKNFFKSQKNFIRNNKYHRILMDINFQIICDFYILNFYSKKYILLEITKIIKALIRIIFLIIWNFYNFIIYSLPKHYIIKNKFKVF